MAVFGTVMDKPVLALCAWALMSDDSLCIYIHRCIVDPGCSPNLHFMRWRRRYTSDSSHVEWCREWSPMTLKRAQNVCTLVDWRTVIVDSLSTKLFCRGSTGERLGNIFSECIRFWLFYLCILLFIIGVVRNRLRYTVFHTNEDRHYEDTVQNGFQASSI